MASTNIDHLARPTPDGRVRHRAFLGVGMISLILAWHNRFVQDDAFISFHYARSLIEGTGLTWFGDRVEGYTNFLWVLWIAGGLLLGIDPIAWSWAGSLVAFGIVLWATHRIASIVSSSPLVPPLSVLLLGTNYSFSCYATGGLETMWQTGWVLWAAERVISLRPDQSAARRLCAISFLVAAAILTRMDSAVLCVPLGGMALTVAWRSRDKARCLVALIVPVGVAVGGWLVWKLGYYGDVLPNTYYAKVGWSWSKGWNGVLYLARFLHWYLLWPFLGALFLHAVKVRGAGERGGRVGWRLLSASCAVWVVYVCGVSGDFMEFRFWVPICPWLFILIARAGVEDLGRWLNRPLLAGALTVLVLGASSWRHAVWFRGISEDKTLDSIESLGSFYGRYPDHNWDRVGRRLGQELSGTGAVLAIHAVGAIPYYSRLETVDMLGLNDRDVARYGTVADPGYARPGHQRHALLGYLKQRGVTLVLGHPTLVKRKVFLREENEIALANWVRSAVSFNTEPIGEATVVGIPIDGESLLLAWILVPRKSLLVRLQDWPIQVLHNP